MRCSTPLTLALLGCLFLPTGAPAQQPDAQGKSLVQRIASLRLGWGDDDKQPSRPTAAKPSGDDQGEGYTLMGRLPRLNPAELLPGDVFSGATNQQRPARATVQSHSGSTTHRIAHRSVGSARARIMRDLRSQQTPSSVGGRDSVQTTPTRTTSAPASRPTAEQRYATRQSPRPQAKPASAAESRPTVLQRSATGRAGSVLSGSDSPGPQDTPSASKAVLSETKLRRELLGPVAMATSSDRPRASTKTAQSVAAAVASSMASEEDPQAEEGQDIEAILKAATSAPVAKESSSLPSGQRATPAQEDTDPPAPTAAPSVPDPAPPATTVEPPATAPDEATPTTPAGQDITPLPEQAPDLGPVRMSSATPGATQDDSQEAARRRFEQDVEQSLAPRTAPDTPGADRFTRREPVGRASIGEQHRATTDTDVLMSQRLPLIVSRVSGPRKIVIGREATYRVSIANRGDEAADQLVTQIDVPEWAEVVGSRSTTGMMDPPEAGPQGAAVRWRMPDLKPGAVEHLDLRIVARAGRPIELGVHWKHAPVGSRAIVEVQEPMLRLSVDGPSEVQFGKPQRYRLNLSNPGTGPAENVVVRLTPPGGGPRDAQQHSLGALREGESRSIDFEFTAQQAGQLTLSAEAEAMGDLTSRVSKDLFCRKAELEVDWRGPSQKYAGSKATYYFRVRNPGTATAEGVTLRLELPRGFDAKQISGNGKLDPTGRVVLWRLGNLQPGDDYYTELGGLANQPGANELRVAATDGSRTASHDVVATTEVITVADLKLEIGDPKGPVPVGRDTVYEVRVRNRGTSTAEAVDVVGLFSEGIDPYRVEGAQASIADGRVTIRKVDRLTVGSELVIRIYAKATRPGTHIFRAEVLCQDLDIKLAAEETTRFYQEDPLEVGQAAGFGGRR